MTRASSARLAREHGQRGCRKIRRFGRVASNRIRLSVGQRSVGIPASPGRPAWAPSVRTPATTARPQAPIANVSDAGDFLHGITEKPSNVQSTAGGKEARRDPRSHGATASVGDEPGIRADRASRHRTLESSSATSNLGHAHVLSTRRRSMRRGPAGSLFRNMRNPRGRPGFHLCKLQAGVRVSAMGRRVRPVRVEPK